MKLFLPALKTVIRQEELLRTTLNKLLEFELGVCVKILLDKERGFWVTCDSGYTALNFRHFKHLNGKTLIPSSSVGFTVREVEVSDFFNNIKLFLQHNE